MSVSTPSGTLSVSATGLPAGVTINAANGTIGGAPTTNGHYLATILASNGSQTTSTDVVIDGRPCRQRHPDQLGVVRVSGAWHGVHGHGGDGSDADYANCARARGSTRSRAWRLRPTSRITVGQAALSPRRRGDSADPLVHLRQIPNNYVSQISFVSKSGKVFGPYGAAQAGGPFARSTTRCRPATRSTPLSAVLTVTCGPLVSATASAAIHRTPSISAMSAQQNIVGAAASVAATATDLDGNPLTYGATGCQTASASIRQRV